MQILRDNRDTLMAVLDAFIHDPLVEWEDERKRMVSIIISSSVTSCTNAWQERDAAKRGGNAARQLDMKQLARNALDPIQKKLSGIYATSGEGASKEKEVSTRSLVQTLIQQATNESNLVRLSCIEHM